MKIKLFWPNCKYINRQWVKEGIDSFWVECKLEEAKEKVFPLMTLMQTEECMKTRHIQAYIESECMYFLISKDLQSIHLFPWHYPYSGQWNGYCPFLEVDEIEISELSEIKEIE